MNVLNLSKKTRGDKRRNMYEYATKNSFKPIGKNKEKV
jgi:hypothetical protein